MQNTEALQNFCIFHSLILIIQSALSYVENLFLKKTSFQFIVI